MSSFPNVASPAAPSFSEAVAFLLGALGARGSRDVLIRVEEKRVSGSNDSSFAEVYFRPSELPFREGRTGGWSFDIEAARLEVVATCPSLGDAAISTVLSNGDDAVTELAIGSESLGGEIVFYRTGERRPSLILPQETWEARVRKILSELDYVSGKDRLRTATGIISICDLATRGWELARLIEDDLRSGGDGGVYGCPGAFRQARFALLDSDAFVAGLLLVQSDFHRVLFQL